MTRRLVLGVALAAVATWSLKAAPPPAVLTLDGAPYIAGAPIAAEGTHLLVATATDCAGHAASVHALFTIDTTPPALRSTVPAANARVTTAPGTFSGVSDPDLARATVNGSAATVSAAELGAADAEKIGEEVGLPTRVGSWIAKAKEFVAE